MLPAAASSGPLNEADVTEPTASWPLRHPAKRQARASSVRPSWMNATRLGRTPVAPDAGPNGPGRPPAWGAPSVCDSVDGTYLAFGPDQNLPTLFTWLDPDQPGLFGGVA
jgi:hypothetical protein